MSTKDQIVLHASQIGRLEQAMTALAEAQVKTEGDTRALRRALTAMAKAQAKTAASIVVLAEAQAQTERQWQAYLTTLPKN